MLLRRRDCRDFLNPVIGHLVLIFFSPFLLVQYSCIRIPMNVSGECVNIDWIFKYSQVIASEIKGKKQLLFSIHSKRWKLKWMKNGLTQRTSMYTNLISKKIQIVKLVHVQVIIGMGRKKRTQTHTEWCYWKCWYEGLMFYK